MSKKGTTIGPLDDVAAVIADVLGIRNLIPCDLVEVQAVWAAEAEAMVFAHQQTRGTRVWFVLSGDALNRMTEHGRDALEEADPWVP